MLIEITDKDCANEDFSSKDDTRELMVQFKYTRTVLIALQLSNCDFPQIRQIYWLFT